MWLRSLGLGKYEAAFRENEIDETVLPNLTAEDLKVWASASSATAVKSSTPLPRCAPIRAPRRLPLTQRARPVPRPYLPKTAERRQVTVMFSDLVGSTALSARMPQNAKSLRPVSGASLRPSALRRIRSEVHGG